MNRYFYSFYDKNYFKIPAAATTSQRNTSDNYSNLKRLLKGKTHRPHWLRYRDQTNNDKRRNANCT
ncbi:MAG: hypothetical protein LBJ00_00935 [Planctomycetaceae bacterium]|nr:hypothetical protein [Planctomycetaceae bacterium]